MEREAIGIGATIEEAQQAACRQLGMETHEVEFEVLQMPEKKKFGLFGGAPAKVRAYISITPASAAADYLREILEKMGAQGVQINIEEVEGGAVLNLSGDNIGFIIGHRGETLDALQYLTGLVANHVDNSYYRITINTGNYREKREKTLESLARKMAIKAVKTGRNSSLEPMNPYERRIIHTTVQKVNGAISWSEGEDMGRHVVIGPDPKVKQSFRPRREGAGLETTISVPGASLRMEPRERPLPAREPSPGRKLKRTPRLMRRLCPEFRLSRNRFRKRSL